MSADYAVGEMPESLRLEVVKCLAAHEASRIAEATARIRRAGNLGGERKPLDDGISGGEVTMTIDPTSYHYWGQRLGYQCWSDATFCREYLRDNPYARVKNVGKKVKVWVKEKFEQAGNILLPPSGGGRRERIVYN